MRGNEKKRGGSDWTTGLLTGGKERGLVGEEQAGLLLDLLPGEETMRGEVLLLLCHQIGDPHLVVELAVL